MLVEIITQVVLLYSKLGKNKKRFSPKIEGYLSSKLGEDQTKRLYRNLALDSAGTGGIFLC